MSATAALPGFWMDETSGVLRPVVERYLSGQLLSSYDVGVMRAYLRQWVNAPGFIGPDVRQLRESLNEVSDAASLEDWLDRAEEAGIDPF